MLTASRKSRQTGTFSRNLTRSSRIPPEKRDYRNVGIGPCETRKATFRKANSSGDAASAKSQLGVDGTGLQAATEYLGL
jgi:hypothetical protein